MAEASTCCFYLLFFMMLQFVKTNPTCRPTDGKEIEVVCTVSDDTVDFILKRGLVSDDDKTVNVVLRGCRIIDIEFEAFENLVSLKYIDLSQNHISYIKLGVLDDARQVSNLNLSYNALTGLPLGLFDQKTNLEILDLKSNRLEQLELGIFDPLEKLKHLNLASNLLLGKNLNPYIFDRSKQIKYLDFSDNDLSEAPNNLLNALRFLDFLNLHKCKLTRVPSFIRRPNLRTVKQLNLSVNKISNLKNTTEFAYFENLEILDLSDNVLEDLDENIFKPLKKLKVIILRNNKISHLSDSLFLNMKNLMNIDLSHNLIASVPVRAFMGTAVKNLNLSHNRFTYLIDNFCLELRNTGASLKKFFFNNNPWQCSCLLAILGEVKRMGIAYNSVNYDGTHAVCVTTAEMSCKRHDTFNLA